MHSTDATHSTEPAIPEPRQMIELRTGEPVETPARLTYNASEVADLLGVGERYIWHLIGTGELKSVKLANRRMVLAEDLDAFVEQLKTERDAFAEQVKAEREQLAAEREKALRGAS